MTPADQVKARIETVYGDARLYTVGGYLPADPSNDTWDAYMLTVTRINDAQNPIVMTIIWRPDAQGQIIDLAINVDANAGEIVNLLGRL